MAKIYYKTATDNTLLCEPREMIVRQINTGSAWTDLRLGAYAGMVLDTDDNSLPSSTGDEIPLQNNFQNRIYFGLKTSGSAFPGTQDVMFVGSMSSGSTSTYKWNYNYAPYPSYLGSSENKIYGAGISGSVSYLGTNASTNFSIPDGTSMAGTSQYCGGWGLRILINNRGLSNQTLSLYNMTANTISTPYTYSSLRTWLATQGQVSLGTVTWNDGSTAYPLPNHFFLYMPYNIMRMRISCMGAWVFAP